MFSVLNFRKRKLARLVLQADELRDNKQAARAAQSYELAVRMAPHRADLFVQYGNMLKDSGQLAEAVRAYESAHNGFVAQAAQRGPDYAREVVSDVYVQLGHAFKLAGARDYAIDFYRRANALKPIPHIQEEIKIAELTLHGVPEKTLEIAYPLLDELPDAISQQTHILAERSPTDKDNLMEDGMQCLCWSSNYFVSYEQRSAVNGLVTCECCGSMYSGDIVKMNRDGESRLIGLAAVGSPEIEALLTTWPLELRFSRIGLIGAELSDSPSATLPSIVTIPTFNNRLQPGLERCSFDAIIIWSVSDEISDIRRVVNQAHQALRPNGLLIVGYRPSSAWTLTMQKMRRKRTSEAQATVGQTPIKEASPSAALPPSPLFVFSDIALRSLLEPLHREGYLFPVRHHQSATHHFLAMQKSGTMSVGIMSGIGDAVWSFVIQNAVRQKYGADALMYHVNDSGDGRRKRSNNMLARFRFVDDMVTSKFQIHADHALSETTGHLNYLPSGPTTIDSVDEFDYRMIANTYLEHGYDYERIAHELGLDPRHLDFDFFQSYQEEPNDTDPVKKITKMIGEDFAVFYYGAEVDNTVGGLNRDEIWRPEDWNRLGKMLHAEFGLKIVVIGAPYDASYANRILRNGGDHFYYNAIGELDITETLSLIQRSKFVVAFPAGVGIVGPYMRVPTAIFWRPKHMSYHVMHERAGFNPKFAQNWVPSEVFDAGDYYPAWYGLDTPESIFQVVKDRGWASRVVIEPIGNWPSKSVKN